MANLRSKLYFILLIAVMFSGISLQANVLPEEKAVSKENRFKGEYLGLAGLINLISDDAVTDSNDSLETGWIPLGLNANYVELFSSVDDTVDVRYYVDYAAGPEGTYYATVAIDSIKSTGTASTQVSTGKVLRNASATNLIPGANYIRYRGYFQTASEATGAVRVWLEVRS